MTYAQAIRAALAAIEREIKAQAVDANLHDVAGATYPHAVNASKRRKNLQEAIARLREPK